MPRAYCILWGIIYLSWPRYSYRNVSTGFWLAALHVWTKVVATDTSNVARTAVKNIHQDRSIRYAKFISQRLTINHATGIPIREDISTRIKVSIWSSLRTPPLPDPKVFRIPISLVRLRMLNRDSPNNPRQEVIIARRAAIRNDDPKLRSALYCSW